MGVMQVPPELARERRRAFRNGGRASCVQRVRLPACARRGRGADVTQRCRGRSADARYWPKRSATASFSRAAVISPMCDSTRLPFASKKSVVGSPREP